MPACAVAGMWMAVRCVCSGVGCVKGDRGPASGRHAVQGAWLCGCVCESVVGSGDGPTARAVRRGMWLLSVMTVTMVVGVCMVCACVHGVCACVFVGIGRWAGCAVWAVLTRVRPGLTWTGPRAGADVLTGVT